MTAAAHTADRRAVGDTLLLTAGLAVAQLILWAVLPLWSRLYDAHAFAQLGLWTSVVSIVSMLLLLRYDSCIVIARDEAEARALLRLCLQLAAGGGVLLALGTLALPERLLAALGLAPLGDWLAVAVLGGALAAMFAALLGYANRHRRYRRLTAARVLQAGVAAAVGAMLGGVAGGLLWAQLAAAIAALPLLFAGAAALPAAEDKPAAEPTAATSGAIAAAARAHSRAPRYLWPSAMLDAVTQQLPMLLAVSWFAAEQAGQFSLAWRVAAVPVLVLAAAAGTVFYQRFAALHAGGGHAAARALLLRQWRGFALAGALPALVLATAGGPLFAWLFGAPWREAGWLAAALAPMLWAMLVSSPTSGALIVLGLQKHAPWFGIAMLAYRPAALWLGAQQGSLVLGLLLWGGCEIAAIVLYNRLLLRRLQR